MLPDEPNQSEPRQPESLGSPSGEVSLPESKTSGDAPENWQDDPWNDRAEDKPENQGLDDEWLDDEQPDDEVDDEEAIAPTQKPQPGPVRRSSPTRPTRSPVSQPAASQPWQQVQLLLKTQSIQTLKTTIRVLEGVVEKLEAEPTTADSLPPSVVSSSSAKTPDLETASEPALPSEVTPSNPVSLPLTPAWSEKFLAVWQSIQSWWRVALRQIRVRLPESVNRQLSDRALTAVITTVVLIGIWTTSSLFSDKATEVAIAPPQPSPSADLSQPPVPNAPENPNPVPKPVSSPPASQPLTPAASPSPVLDLTPEQSLIAAIQTQVAEVTDQYADGLIQSVQANFKSSRLTVTVGEDWYTLNQNQQNKLADEMLKRSRELDFSRLEISDLQRVLLARTPVVGDSMVILKRQKPNVSS